MPVKDALCRDVHIDYGKDIINVRDILDATNARKNIFNDSVELHKLTLKQISLVHTYESDAQQVKMSTSNPPLPNMRDSLSGVSFFEITSNLRFTQSGPFKYLSTNYS